MTNSKVPQILPKTDETKKEESSSTTATITASSSTTSTTSTTTSTKKEGEEDEKSAEEIDDLLVKTKSTASLMTPEKGKTVGAKKKRSQSRAPLPMKNDAGESKLEIIELRLHFGLDREEVFFKSTAAILQGGFMKKVGRLYIFAKHIVFESTVFGSRAQEKIPLDKILSIEIDEKKQEIVIETKSNKLRLGYIFFSFFISMSLSLSLSLFLITCSFNFLIFFKWNSRTSKYLFSR